MAGMKFEYDENGGSFSYFLLSVYALVLLFITYWSWPKREVKQSKVHPEDTSIFEPCQEKYRLVHENEPSRRRRGIFKKIAFVIAWIVFVVLIYRTTLIENEQQDYDPFAVLNVDPEASVSEIKRAYRELSKTHHPDRGGDPEKFKEIAKAYRALTDEEAKENWKKYGNPDGPGVTHFGIALPKWLVDHKNSLVVLLIYTGIFMIVLPVIICIWYQKTALCVGEEILLDTIQFYSGLIRTKTTMNIKSAIMILSFAKEFDRTRNPAIIDRPSDNIEIPKLMRQIEDIPKKNKGLIQHPYSIKARTLIYAQLLRLGPLTDELEKDKRYVIKRALFLINGMINIEGQLVAVKQAGGLKSAPNLLSIENTMKLSPMIVQALFNPNNPMLQLPYLNETHLKYFETKKRTIRSIQQFLALDDKERRLLLRTLTDEQYHDIINVVSIYPYVTMNVSWKVFDDENECKITAGAVITLTVHIQRENMSSLFSKHIDEEEQIDEKENQEKTDGAVKNPTTPASKSWNSKKKKTNKDKGKKKGVSTTSKSTKQPITTTQTNESTEHDSSKLTQDSSMNINRPSHDVNESDNENEEENALLEEDLHTNDSDDEFLEKFQEQQRKREQLETKTRISHQVYCPFFPEIKQECWWLYVADRKRNTLISIPIHIATLKDQEETEVKFKAPDKRGHYEYTVHLRSDSYFGVDVNKTLPLDVEDAKEVENDHPQWNFGDDEVENDLQNDDNQFATESDSDTN